MHRTTSFLITLALLIVGSDAQSQNVGIGTTNPNASAQLHISSTTRGFLPPRMTTTQREAISNPLNGLMVYDITEERTYIHIDGDWQYALDSRVWLKNLDANRRIVYTVSDSIGIGTSSPGAKLGIIGDVQILAGDLRQLGGNISTNGDITINATSATLNLNSGGVEKGFVQLSGDNLRLGTFSSNADGQIVLRSGGADRMVIRGDNGRVGIGTSSPTEPLDVNGNINFNGKLTRTNSGNAALTPLCWGRMLNVLNGGVFAGTSNLSISRIGTGHYRITCPGITANSVVFATPYALGVFVVWDYFGPDQMDIRTYRTVWESSTWELFNQVFSFIIYNE